MEDDSQFYRYFRYDSSVYVYDRETEELLEILKEVFRKVCEQAIYDTILREGEPICGEEALEKSDFTYIPAHMDEWLESSQAGRSYETTKQDTSSPPSEKKGFKIIGYEGDRFVFDIDSFTLYKISRGSVEEISNPDRFSRVISNGYIISEETAMGNS